MIRRAVIAVIAIAGCHHVAAPGALPANVAMAGGACVHGHDDLDFPVIDSQPESRMRNEEVGALGSNDQREWGGQAVPSYVDRKLGTQELFILDRTDGGMFAFYRDPYDVGSCKLADASNCRYTARLYDGSGQVQWSVALGKLLSRNDQLEIQDVRLLDGVVYFNEACQGYSTAAGGDCSRLVAVDPRAGRVLWRTPPLVSNDRFRVRGCYLIAGYGFTGEPDTLSVVDRTTGTVKMTRALPKAASRIDLASKSELVIALSSGSVGRFQLAGFETTAPTLISETAVGDGSVGGFGYGGAAYGGAMYGGSLNEP